jgi:hypothetical protein
LDESLVKELLSWSGEKTESAAVAAAVKEQIRRAKREKLSSMLGKVAFDEEAPKESEQADQKRQLLLEELGN